MSITLGITIKKTMFVSRWIAIYSINYIKNSAVKKDFEIVAELKTSINKNLDDLFEIFPYQEIRFSKYCNGIQLFNKN